MESIENQYTALYVQQKHGYTQMTPMFYDLLHLIIRVNTCRNNTNVNCYNANI